MVTSVDSKRWQIGLVGYGEVRQAWIADLADDGAFGPRGTPSFARSPDWRSEADRILDIVTEKKQAN